MKHLAFLLALPLAAQTLTLTSGGAATATVQAGGSIPLTETLTVPAGVQMAGFQRQATGLVTGMTLGVPLSSWGGKSPWCFTSNVLCMLIGANGTATATGAPASITSANSALIQTAPILTEALAVASSVPAGTYSLNLAGLQGTDPNGKAVAVTPGPALVVTVTVARSVFDVDGDGKVGLSDLGAAITQVLQSATNPAACTTGDVNADKACNVTDVEAIIHALGL